MYKPKKESFSRRKRHSPSPVVEMTTLTRGFSGRLRGRARLQGGKKAKSADKDIKALCENKLFTTSVNVGINAAVTGRDVWFPEQIEACEYVLFVGMINEKRRNSQ